MAKKTNVNVAGETIDLIRIPVEEIEIGRTYVNWVGNLVKVLSYNEETRIMSLRNISEACKQDLDINWVNLIKLVR